MGVKEVDLYVLEDWSNGEFVFDHHAFGFGEDREGFCGIGFVVGGIKESVEGGVGVFAVVIAVAGFGEVEEGGGVAIVAEPTGATGHEVCIFEVVAKDLDFLLLE